MAGPQADQSSQEVTAWWRYSEEGNEPSIGIIIEAEPETWKPIATYVYVDDGDSDRIASLCYRLERMSGGELRQLYEEGLLYPLGNSSVTANT